MCRKNIIAHEQYMFAHCARLIEFPDFFEDPLTCIPTDKIRKKGKFEGRYMYDSTIQTYM